MIQGEALERVAAHYLEKGWEVLPLPPNKKASPPPGTTGRTGRPLTFEELCHHLRLQAVPTPPPTTTLTSAHATGNLGLRLPDTVVGIDTDAYDGKFGGATLLEAVAANGPLPKTFRLTARDPQTDPYSGVRFYRVPKGFELGTIGQHVDTIRHGWRYVVAAPSIHPKTGTPYQWYGPTDPLTPTQPPSIHELPELPVQWLEAFPLIQPTAAAHQSAETFRAAPSGATASELAAAAQEWFKSLPPLNPAQPPCEDVHHATIQGVRAAKREGPTGTGRTDLLSPILRLTLAAGANCRGVREAIAAIGAAYTSLPDAVHDNHSWKLWHLIGSTLDRLGEHSPWECEHYTPQERLELEAIATSLEAAAHRVTVGGAAPRSNPHDPTSHFQGAPVLHAPTPDEPAPTAAPTADAEIQVAPVYVAPTNRIKDQNYVKFEALKAAGPDHYETFSLDDAGNGIRLALAFNQRVFYADDGTWRLWKSLPGTYSPGGIAGQGEPGQWIQTTKEDAPELKQAAKELPSLLATEMVACGHGPGSESLLTDSYQDAIEQAGDSSAQNRARQSWTALHSSVAAKATDWDNNPYLLGVQNGVVDLRTGALRSEGIDDRILSRSIAAYDPDRQDAPEWEKFLRHACNYDDSLVEYLQQAIGYTLTGLVDLEIMFIISGPSGSGKSTFLSILQTVFGNYAVGLDSSMFVSGFQGKSASSMETEIMRLKGTRLSVLNEWPQHANTREDQLKYLTGERTFRGRALYQNAIDFQATTKFWVGTNHLPRIEDPAMWRRIRALTFDNTPKDGDKDNFLKERLLGLKEGSMENSDGVIPPDGAVSEILGWAVAGAMKVLARIAAEDQTVLALTECRAIEEATAAYREHEDRFGLFIEEELEEDAEASVSVTELRTQHEYWLESRGEKPVTRIAFDKTLKDRGFNVRGRGTNAVLLGYKYRLKLAAPLTNQPGLSLAPAPAQALQSLSASAMQEIAMSIVNNARNEP